MMEKDFMLRDGLMAVHRGLLISVIVIILLIGMVPLAVTVDCAGENVKENVVSGSVEFKASGQPAEGVKVTAYYFSNGTIANVSTTDSDGNYSLILPNGTYNFSAELMGYRADNPLYNQTIDSDVVLDNLSNRGPLLLVPVFGRVAGNVSYKEGPVIGANVSIWTNEEMLNYTSTDESGYYDMQVMIGERELRVIEPGFSEIVTNVSIEEGNITRTDFELIPLSNYSLSGRVVAGATGEGLKDVEVTVTPESGVISPQTTKTNETGYFRFDELIEDNYTISVSRDAYITLLIPYDVITLRENKTLDYPIVMREAYGELSGEVASSTFLIADALVLLIDPDSNEKVDETTTNTKGIYYFEKVPTGDYIVRVERNGFISTEQPVRIDEGETAILDFDLARIDQSYIFGQDLPHTLMIVGAVIALFMMLVSFYIRIKAGEDPNLLYPYEEEEEVKTD